MLGWLDACVHACMLAPVLFVVLPLSWRSGVCTGWGSGWEECGHTHAFRERAPHVCSWVGTAAHLCEHKYKHLLRDPSRLPHSTPLEPPLQFNWHSTTHARIFLGAQHWRRAIM